MKHLSDETVAAYLDRTITLQERSAVDAHLVDCSRCRSDVLGARRAMAGGKAVTRRRLLAAGTTLAAAVVAGLLLLPSADESMQRPSPLRSTSSETLLAIPPLAPLLEADGIEGALALRWRSVGGVSTYRVTLTDGAGAVLWSGETQDTGVVIPREVNVEAGSTLFWFVDATLTSGESASTGVQTLIVR